MLFYLGQVLRKGRKVGEDIAVWESFLRGFNKSQSHVVSEM